MSYDKIITKNVGGEKIRYGILWGNEKIVFIKVGADGSIMGYKNKYPQMARRLHERMGATVICAANPLTEQSQVDADKAVIQKVAAEIGCDSYEVSFFGTSDGAYHNLSLAKAVPQSVKLVCVNTSTYGFDGLKKKLLDLPDVKMIFVYGDKDDEYPFAAQLQKLNFEVITLAGADHQFTGMLEEYIGLTDLL